MSYIAKTMTGSEAETLDIFKQSKWQYARISNILIVPAIVMLIKRLGTEYGSTDTRLITKVGFISRNTDELKINAIESVMVQQSFMGRILGYGDVEVTGRGNNTVTLKDVCRPLDVKKSIETAGKNM